jgi:hypothetical protein
MEAPQKDGEGFPAALMLVWALSTGGNQGFYVFPAL